MCLKVTFIIQDVLVKLNPGFPWNRQQSTRRPFFRRKLVSLLRKKLVKCYIWSIALYGSENLTFLKVDQKYLKMFEIVVLEKEK
jgi:hypothetical protein